jgi:hypothetical protein
MVHDPGEQPDRPASDGTLWENFAVDNYGLPYVKVAFRKGVQRQVAVDLS